MAAVGRVPLKVTSAAARFLAPPFRLKYYPFSSASPLRMGTVGKQEFFNGNLDEVAIFSRKLTQEEVTTLYNARS